MPPSIECQPRISAICEAQKKLTSAAALIQVNTVIILTQISYDIWPTLIGLVALFQFRQFLALIGPISLLLHLLHHILSILVINKLFSTDQTAAARRTPNY